MRYPKLLCIIALMGLTACSGGGNAASSSPGTPGGPPPAQGPGDISGTSATHPVYGTLTPAQVELLGADNDGNGVRDDVDQFIAQKFSVTPLARKAVTAYAKEVTVSMLYADKLISRGESSRRLAVFYCAANEIERAGVANAENWNSIIVARATDTEERLRAYDKWDRAQNVSTSINLEVNPCVQAGL